MLIRVTKKTMSYKTNPKLLTEKQKDDYMKEDMVNEIKKHILENIEIFKNEKELNEINKKHTYSCSLFMCKESRIAEVCILIKLGRYIDAINLLNKDGL